MFPISGSRIPVWKLCDQRWHSTAAATVNKMQLTNCSLQVGQSMILNLKTISSSTSDTKVQCLHLDKTLHMCRTDGKSRATKSSMMFSCMAVRFGGCENKSLLEKVHISFLKQLALLRKSTTHFYVVRGVWQILICNWYETENDFDLGLTFNR